MNWSIIGGFALAAFLLGVVLASAGLLVLILEGRTKTFERQALDWQRRAESQTGEVLRAKEAERLADVDRDQAREKLLRVTSWLRFRRDELSIRSFERDELGELLGVALVPNAVAPAPATAPPQPKAIPTNATGMTVTPVKLGRDPYEQVIAMHRSRVSSSAPSKLGPAAPNGLSGFRSIYEGGPQC